MPKTVSTNTDLRQTNGVNVSQLFQIFNLISDPIFIVDIHLKFQYFNEAFLRIIHSWNFPPPQKDQHITEVLPFITNDLIVDYRKIIHSEEVLIERTKTFPDDPNAYTISILPSIGEKKPDLVTTIIKYQSTEIKAAKKIKNVEKKYEGIMKALRESEDKFRKLITQMGEGVWLFDCSKKTTFINDALRHMLRYPETEIIGHSITDFMLSTSQNEFNKVLLSLDNQSTSNPIEITFLNKSGVEVDTRLILSTLTDPNNQKIGSFCVISDITQEKSLQDLQERFIATTAHELRTPLTVLNGYLDVLQIGPDLSQEDLLAIIEKMSRNVNRLIRLVRNVHDLSSVRANLFTINRKKVDLFEFIIEVKDQIGILFPKRNIFWDTNVTSDSKITFCFDSERIKQTIENLTQNAVKNSPKESPINIRIQKLGDELTIVVQDQGIGISNESMLQLFKPFAHKPTRYSQTGTGLGLYIIKIIVQAHGGKIEVVSGEESSGSIFTIKIPEFRD
ncbi:MAG: PAS domain-containing sensor histidine kinase [Candidatus Hodarchaeales archaeon]